MRNLQCKGIEVTSTSSSDLASSRRHFMSTGTLLAGVLMTVMLPRTQAMADDNSEGHRRSNGHSNSHGHSNSNGNSNSQGHSNGGGGAHCFLKGTQILAPQGERSVDDLRIGDLVLTVSGESKPIKWIGRMRFERDRQATWDDSVLPIKIARGAFNGDLPHSDLYVSDGHRFLINGLLIPAGNLVNGISITRWTPTNWDVVDYLHIELESHDVILANGAPAETLEGNASRIDFDNFEEYVALYGAALSHQSPYAPIVACYGRRQALRSHLRGALAPICDRRQPLEIIQDALAREAYRRFAA
jgi:hypothetical protein